jgi:hypothetical protein
MDAEAAHEEIFNRLAHYRITLPTPADAPADAGHDRWSQTAAATPTHYRSRQQ